MSLAIAIETSKTSSANLTKQLPQINAPIYPQDVISYHIPRSNLSRNLSTVLASGVTQGFLDAFFLALATWHLQCFLGT